MTPRKDLLWALKQLHRLQTYLGSEGPGSPISGMGAAKMALAETLPVLDEAIAVLNNIAATLVVAGLDFGPGGSQVRPEFFKLTAEQIRSVVGGENV